MIAIQNQYKFLYDVALVFLDQYDSYENFSPMGSLLQGKQPLTANGTFGESSETESAAGDHTINTTNDTNYENVALANDTNYENVEFANDTNYENVAFANDTNYENVAFN